jgi:hypothetical protein
MEVSDQIHVPAVLFMRKIPLYPVNRKRNALPEPFLDVVRKEKIFDLAGTRI